VLVQHSEVSGRGAAEGRAAADGVASARRDSEELALVRGLLARERTAYRGDAAAATALLGVGSAPRDPALDPIELAAWTATARAVLNLHEAIARY
jgi:hypothetical protein